MSKCLRVNELIENKFSVYFGMKPFKKTIKPCMTKVVIKTKLRSTCQFRSSELSHPVKIRLLLSFQNDLGGLRMN